ncbi:ATP-binding protein [Paenibacillus sp. FJAT-27812]|uniref:ATP-binding protein n=1 Tax=Paenibacillus sp. FJAT-27812 TaxID=1684143 RepID=UPI001E57A912|nr:ATP-binding protein [Paenibacillus sp. FJAT-27812]
MICLTTARDYGSELDLLTKDMNELKQLVSQLISARSPQKLLKPDDLNEQSTNAAVENELGAIFYSGQYHGGNGFRWAPRQQDVAQLLDLNSDKVAKILAALGNKQRLDILTAVMRQPLTGSEIVEQLNMGTTGQLYHHTKALLGADLLMQEERGGKYSLPPHRSLPFLLLLAASSDLLDTTDYMELTEVRNDAESYLGAGRDYDPHHLLWSVVENTLLEHQAGYSTEVTIIVQDDKSITVADNGRGIPTQAFPHSTKTPVQAVLTGIGHFNASASILAPGGLKGIDMPVVNALSEKLSVEVRRDGKVFRQDFKHGIPQSELMIIGVTKETGTTLTFTPDQHVFGARFDKTILTNQIAELRKNYPNLKIELLD